MNITRERIKKLQPCAEGWAWYIKNQKKDLLELLIAIDGYSPSWARWLFTHLMNGQQRRKIAVFSALLVIDIFEKRYPEDKRPRLAIDAALAVIKANTKANRELARAAYAAAAYAAAAYAAYAAAASAYAAAASASASAAAASASADAAYASAYAADAADAAADADAAYAAKKLLREKIIRQAVLILEKKDEQ